MYVCIYVVMCALHTEEKNINTREAIYIVELSHSN